jgi:ribonuclease HI
VGLVLYVDGGSRGNPGPAGAGVVLHDDAGGRVHEAGYFLGTQTNNAAEYQALIRGVQRAGKCNEKTLTIFADSELLVKQLLGEYRVKSPSLAKLYEQAQLALLRVGRWSIQHVRREGNAHADRLANLAMDKRRDVIVFDVEKGGAQDIPEADPADDFLREAEQKRADLAAAGAPGKRGVQVAVTAPPKAGVCPAGNWAAGPLAVGATMPGGVCVYAAHALLPTVLAMQGTSAEEYSAMPAMTVRCGRQECRASFLVTVETPTNGHSKEAETESRGDEET